MSFIDDHVERIARKRAWWIDTTIRENIPSWKWGCLKMFPNLWIALILNIDIEIICEELIADFGQRIIIKLNGKMIGTKSFIY